MNSQETISHNQNTFKLRNNQDEQCTVNLSCSLEQRPVHRKYSREKLHYSQKPL